MTFVNNTVDHPVIIDGPILSGVRSRRLLAFAVDYFMVIVLCLVAVPIIGLLGFATFGAGWLLYAILGPLVALLYIGWTVGGPFQASWGMRMMDLRLVRYDGQPIDFMTAVVHAVLFWASISLLTPFIALVTLFTRHKRTLHDLALGTVVVRATQFR